MTFVLASVSEKSLWMLVDRRLSYRDRKPRDDARKMMFLETSDGTALVGYAGLGATVGNTEPSDWMVRVLRGINAPLEPSLSHLRNAVVRQFPRHLRNLWMDNPEHQIVICAFKEGRPRIYLIDIVVNRSARQLQHRFIRVRTLPIELHGQRAERGVLVAVGGSGGQSLLSRFPAKLREVRGILKAYDSEKISSSGVAHYLARLNHKVHLATPDGSVGSRCIVAWRPLSGGGGHDYFDGGQHEQQVGPKLHFMPSLARGMDMAAVLAAVSQPFFDVMATLGPGETPTESHFDRSHAEQRRRVAELPELPDEDLK
jgi:hypothetical protein